MVKFYLDIDFNRGAKRLCRYELSKVISLLSPASKGLNNKKKKLIIAAGIATGIGLYYLFKKGISTSLKKTCYLYKCKALRYLKKKIESDRIFLTM